MPAYTPEVEIANIDVEPEEYFDDCSSQEKAYLFTLAMEWVKDLPPKRLAQLGLEWSRPGLTIEPETYHEREVLDLLEKKWKRLNIKALHDYLESQP